MFVYILACYPAFQYDDCFQEIHLVNDKNYTNEEFEKHCKDAESNDIDIIKNYLIIKHGYKELEPHAVVDIRQWDSEL